MFTWFVLSDPIKLLICSALSVYWGYTYCVSLSVFECVVKVLSHMFNL